MTIDQREFRDALGCFATGVAVATTLAADGRPLGVTINSFASVSLDPPLVLWSLAKASTMVEAFRASGHYAVNILSERQQHLSTRFSLPAQDRWQGIDSDRWQTGAPILRGCIANIECATQAVHDGGDHLILVGRVLRLAADRSARPLLYFGGRYAALA